MEIFLGVSRNNLPPFKNEFEEDKCPLPHHYCIRLLFVSLPLLFYSQEVSWPREEVNMLKLAGMKEKTGILLLLVSYSPGITPYYLNWKSRCFLGPGAQSTQSMHRNQYYIEGIGL